MKKKIANSFKFIDSLNRIINEVKECNASSLNYNVPKHLKLAEEYIFKFLSDIPFSDWLFKLDEIGLYYSHSIETRYVWLRTNKSEQQIMAELLDMSLDKTVFSNHKERPMKSARTICLPLAVAHWRFKKIASSLEKLFHKLPKEHHDRFLEILPDYVWHWGANFEYPDWNGIDTTLDQFLETEKGLRQNMGSTNSEKSNFTKPNIQYIFLSGDGFYSSLYLAGTMDRRFQEQELQELAKEFVNDFIKQSKIAEREKRLLAFSYKNFPLFVDYKFSKDSRNFFFIKNMKLIDSNNDQGPFSLPFNTIIPKKYEDYLWFDFSPIGCVFGKVKDIIKWKNGLGLENNPDVKIWKPNVTSVYDFAID